MMHLLNEYLARVLILLLNYMSPFGLTVQYDLAYGHVEIHRADVYSLANPSGRPIIVYLYGGGWRGGSKGRVAYVGAALARRGFVVVIPEYRHFPQAGLSDILADHAAAVGWTLAHSADLGGDRRRVIIVGNSSGGWGAAMLALDPRWLERVGFRPSDLAGMVGLAGPYMVSSLTERLDREVFKSVGSDMEPINHTSALHPPMLLLTGAADTDVLPTSTATLADRLRQVDGATEARFYDGLEHDDMVRSFAFASDRRGSVADDIETFAKTLPRR